MSKWLEEDREIDLGDGSAKKDHWCLSDLSVLRNHFQRGTHVCGVERWKMHEGRNDAKDKGCHLHLRKKWQNIEVGSQTCEGDST